MRLISAIALAAMLAGCASGSSIPRERIERALAKAPGIAQPSKVVAREIEFARVAQEEGQWTAFRAFAAPGAIIHGPDGPIDASKWLAGRKNPPEAVRWSPDTVWMSCDSTVAVSQGRFRDPAGIVGTFVTVWKLQPDRAYLWVYGAAAPDDPQPAPRVEEPVDPDAIVVSAIDSIRGIVGDCPQRDGNAPSPVPNAIAHDTKHGGGRSPDGTLYWEWYQFNDGAGRFVSSFAKNGVLEPGATLELSEPKVSATGGEK